MIAQIAVRMCLNAFILKTTLKQRIFDRQLINFNL